MTITTLQHHPPMDLWNSRLHELAVLDEVLTRPLIRLDRSGGEPRSPGCYLLFIKAPAGAEGQIARNLYSPLHRGGFPVYVGCAVDLFTRLSDHRRRTSVVPSLHGGRDLWVCSVGLNRYEDAHYAESLLISLLRPVWNEKWASGFGSKDQGPSRRTQAPTAWDLLHPGRQRGSGDTRMDVEELVNRTKAHVRSTQVPELW